MTRIVDGCAGPGGWSEGLRMLGLSEVGIEWDDAACATARAAGHQRVQADVATVDPMDFAPCGGLIFSPPCPTFSNAGKGAGRRDIEHVIACALELAIGNDTRAEHRAACEDERSMLSVEPLRWALALEPEWIALEQVPPVLGLWTLFAQLLEQHGYYTWTGILEAERYGVPQTRERAILMAHRDRPVHPPAPTHQRFVPGEPQRHDVTMLDEVLPWVSMAEALGWGMTDRPSITLTAGSSRQGGPDPLDGGSGARASLRRERDRGAWVVQTNNFTSKRRDLDGKRTKQGSEMYERPIDEPAPTLTARADTWALDRRQGGAPVRTLDEPAHTMSSAGLAKGRDVWAHERPDSGSQQRDAIRVTVPEAATLQSFRPDYPWQGTKSKIYQQIGNAVPPLLARAVLSQLIDAVSLEAAA